MDISVCELFDDVTLTCVTTPKFKSGCMSVTFLTQLSRETASLNALIPKVLRRGTRSLPNMEAIAAKLDELYGAKIEPVVRKKGEIQCVGLIGVFPDEKFIPGGGGEILKNCVELLCEMLLSPALESCATNKNVPGGFVGEFVSGEKDKQLEAIKSRVNDKRAYSVERMLELMCFAESYGIDRLGTETATEEITSAALYERYGRLIRESPVSIFYCGGENADTIKNLLKPALKNLPKAPRDTDIGTDVRLNALEEAPRYFSEELDVTQGKLAIGFRLGEAGEVNDIAALKVFNACYGGSVTSKLFENVREKLSLCYFASSLIDRHKGILVVSSGIEFEKYDQAKNEIFAQLDAIKSGDISDGELTAAKKSVASDLRASLDSRGALEDFFLSAIIDGPDIDPEALAELAEEVTRESIVNIANSLECDCIYFLKGSEEAEE